MRKFDRRILQAGIVFTLSVCFCLLFYFILFHSSQFFGFWGKIISVFSPFIVGFFIAYLLNPLLKFIEKKLIKPIYLKFHKPEKKYRKSIVRGSSVLITIALFLAFLYAIIIMIAPQVIESIEQIINNFSTYWNSLTIWVEDLMSNHEDLIEQLKPYWDDISNYSLNTVLPSIQKAFSAPDSAGIWGGGLLTVIGGVYTTLNALYNFFFGIIISIFLLYGKETYVAQLKKIIYAALREERANNLINNGRFAHKKFGGFLSGKIVDSIVIGILTFFILLIFKIPYAVLFSVIIGVTNVIPVFGPLIGAIPSAIILLMISPMKALTFLILVLIIQQLDGNVIGPYILGDSTGLSSFWVIFSITVGGGFFGFLGMFLGVPVFAVIYATIKTFINERLKRKQLPEDTAFYLTSDYHSDDDNSNTGKEIKFVKKTFENIFVEGKGKQVVVKIEPESEKKSAIEAIAELKDKVIPGKNDKDKN